MSALLPCPMCAGTNIARMRDDVRPRHWCECEDCGVRTADDLTRSLSDAAWNRRAPSPLPTQEALINVFRNHICGGLFEGSPQVSGFDDAADAVLRLLGGEKNDG